jgi:hypothetical protein
LLATERVENIAEWVRLADKMGKVLQSAAPLGGIQPAEKIASLSPEAKAVAKAPPAPQAPPLASQG